METLDNEINLIDASTVSPRPAGMKWGLIGGAISIVVGLVGYLTGITTPSADPGAASYIVSFFLFLVGIFCVVKAIQEHRAELGGYIRGGRCVAVGLWSGLFYGLLSAVWALVFYNLIAPDFFNDLYSSMTLVWENQGMGDDEIEMMLGYTKMFQGPLMMPISTLISGLIGGVLLSIIPAFIMKKKAPGMF